MPVGDSQCLLWSLARISQGGYLPIRGTCLNRHVAIWMVQGSKWSHWELAHMHGTWCRDAASHEPGMSAGVLLGMATVWLISTRSAH